MQHISEPDRIEGLPELGQRFEQTGLHRFGMKACESFCCDIETVTIDVEQDEAFEALAIGPIDEKSSADAGFEMVGRQVRVVEVDQTLGRTAPGKSVREPMHQQIVEA